MKLIATIRWHHDGWRSTNQTSDKYLPASVVRWVTVLFWHRLPVLIILFICCFSPLIICRLFLCNRSHSPAGVPLKTRFIKSDHLSLFQCCLCCGSDLAPVWQQEKKNKYFVEIWEMALVVKTHKQRLVAADKWKTSSSVRNNLFFLLFSPFYWSSRKPLSLVFLLLHAEILTLQLCNVRSSRETFWFVSTWSSSEIKERFWTLATL